MKKRKKNGKAGILGRSDIPFAQRMMMQRRGQIMASREHAAKIALFCQSIAMNQVAGIGYKRLIRFSLRFKELEEDFYQDIDVGMAHAKQRMEQMGMPISGELFRYDGQTGGLRHRELMNHSLQASQVALLLGTVAMNDVFGFGAAKQEEISQKTDELAARYAREGEAFLLDLMAGMGFLVEDGKVMAFIGDDGEGVSPARARKEGYVIG